MSIVKKLKKFPLGKKKLINGSGSAKLTFNKKEITVDFGNKKLKVKRKKTFSLFRSKIRSRHPSHSVLRSKLELLPFKSIIRLGSTTDEPDTVTNGGRRVECNTIQGVKNSANKLLMKECFAKAGVKTAIWAKGSDLESIKKLEFPIMAKHLYGSRGSGNTYIEDLKELEQFIKGKTLANYIFEKYYTFSKEYRLHITSEGCFYSCRKMLKKDTPEDKRVQRHDDNCVWILENNPDFDKPINWNRIIEESVKAVKSVGLDVGSVDIKTQSSKDSKGNTRKEVDFIIIETNSASSFGNITAQKYLEEIPRILRKKYQQLK